VLFAWRCVAYDRQVGAWLTAKWERRYVGAGQTVHDNVKQPAVVLAGLHSGSLRIYGDVQTARYDLGTPAMLRDKLQDVERACGSVYLLGDPDEIDAIKAGDRAFLLDGAEELDRTRARPNRLFRLRVTPPAELDAARCGQRTSRQPA
jgi:hypothetical protein